MPDSQHIAYSAPNAGAPDGTGAAACACASASASGKTGAAAASQAASVSASASGGTHSIDPPEATQPVTAVAPSGTPDSQPYAPADAAAGRTTDAPQRTLTYFTSDVHLGLDVKDPADREKRFVDFLDSIEKERTEALYLLGDIWDFWYEYRDVVPKGYVRVFAALMDLMEAGVKVYFFQGNHDIWCYHYFEDMGISILQQPALVTISGTTFCLGHGDGLGPGMRWYKLMRWGFRAPFFQGLFSLLHPTIAFRFGKGWSKHSRLSRWTRSEDKKQKEYVFNPQESPVCVWAEEYSRLHHVDCFIFGHYHRHADLQLASGSRMLILDAWFDKSPYIRFDGTSVIAGYSPKSDQ